MKQFLSFLRKEFYHVLRDRKTLLILFGMPLTMILIFGFALTNEVKNTHILIVDNANDATSQKLIERIESSRYFDIAKATFDHRQIEAAFRNGSVKAALVFPEHFAEALRHENKSTLQIITDASDPNTATTVSNYLSAIIRDFGADMNAGKPALSYQIGIETRVQGFDTGEDSIHELDW